MTNDLDMRSYEVGYRDGESSREADYNLALTEAFDDIQDTSPQGVTAYLAARLAAVEAVMCDVIADHRMWIGDDGQPLDFSPEREARIAEFCHEVAAAVRADSSEAPA